MMLVEKHWFEILQMREFERYLTEAKVAPDHRTTICRRVNRCAEVTGGFETLATCNAQEFVDEHFPGEQPRARFRAAAIRWYQRFVRGEPPAFWKKPSCWEGEPLLIRFHQYLLGTGGYSVKYADQLCSLIYWMRYPQQINESRLAIIRRRLWAIRAFDRFCRSEAGIPPKQVKTQIHQKAPHWTASPLMVRFMDHMITHRHTSGGAAIYCQALYTVATLPKPADPITETDLDQILAARMPGRAQEWRRRAVNSLRAFEKFLRAEAGIPEPVKVKPPKPAKVRPPKVKKVRAPKPKKVKLPKPAKVPVVKPPKPAKPIPFERVILARFEQYLLSTETPPQYAETICQSLNWIYRERAQYEVLAVCDPVAFVAEHWPRGDWAQTRSRVATIRRFQAFWQSSELSGNPGRLVEGVLA